MEKAYKVFYTDPSPRGHAVSLAAGTTPLSLPTENAALRFAFDAIRLGRVVWKIESPDGTIVSREQLQRIYRNRPRSGVAQ